MTNKVDYMLLAEEFYSEGFIPAYIHRVGKTFIVVSVSGCCEEITKLKITQDDVAEYYRTEANDMSSGMRSIAGHFGDWRQIDSLAKECIEWFKYVDSDGLRRVCKKRGLEPQW